MSLQWYETDGKRQSIQFTGRLMLIQHEIEGGVRNCWNCYDHWNACSIVLFICVQRNWSFLTTLKPRWTFKQMYLLAVCIWQQILYCPQWLILKLSGTKSRITTHHTKYKIKTRKAWLLQKALNSSNYRTAGEKYNLSRQHCRYTNLCCRTTAESVVVLQYVEKMPPVRKNQCAGCPPWPWKNKLTHNCRASFA